jgi:hypothetical protein
MDKILRRMAKNRGGTYTQHFDFTTFDIAFKKPLQGTGSTNFQKLLKWIRYAFVTGLPADVDRYESCSAALNPQPKSIEEIPKEENELSKLMEGITYRGTQQKQHYLVLNYLLDNDKRAVATEMPLWLTEAGTPNLKPWCGSVDLVRVLPNHKIQICDFKPDSAKVDRKKVGAQLYRYCFMLHVLTGIEMDYIEGIFFDEKRAYKIII